MWNLFVILHRQVSLDCQMYMSPLTSCQAYSPLCQNHWPSGVGGSQCSLSGVSSLRIEDVASIELPWPSKISSLRVWRRFGWAGATGTATCGAATASLPTLTSANFGLLPSRKILEVPQLWKPDSFLAACPLFQPCLVQLLGPLLSFLLGDARHWQRKHCWRLLTLYKYGCSDTHSVYHVVRAKTYMAL